MFRKSIRQILNHDQVPYPELQGQIYRLRSRPNNQMSGGRRKFLGEYSHSRNRSNSAACPPITPLRPNPPPREKRFLEAAEQGDKASLINFIREGIDVNCCDVLGRTALEIAVDNENVEIVEELLMEHGIKVGHALLYGIREGAYRIVESLINQESIKSKCPSVLGSAWSKHLDKDDAMNFDYSADITPVMLAAHLNQFEILKLLKDRGASIEKPHSLSCSCDSCSIARTEDNLRHSLVRIHSYRALASPAWISLTANDPVLEAFRLSWELQRLAFLEWEFREVYLRLSEQCKSFACDLLSQCRSSEEVIALLNKDILDDLEAPVRPGMKLTLARLKLSIKYEQKQFVAHPHCQQLLTSIWYEGFPGRQERGSFMNIFICILLMLAWPIMSTSYILAPKSKLGQIVRSPFMKFLYYSTSFGTFLLLLSFVSSQNSNRPKNTNDWLTSISNRGPMPSAVEWLVFLFVLGMIWAECKQLWDEGFTRYIYQWWNYLDFVMMSLYLCTFVMRAMAIYYEHYNPAPSDFRRIHWKSGEPLLVSEALFAVANVFSFARIVYLFQTNPYLGPLQISLGCMLLDIAKFFIIFFLILTSFAFGLHQLYWHYRDCDSVGAGQGRECDAFNTITNSYVTLLWALFGITTKEDTLPEIIGDDKKYGHQFTKWIGTGMFISYHVTSIVVLLNMLIAMMSFSFQRINENSDLEWKFHRSKLWMSYFDEGSSLAAPFNIVITPKSCIKLLKSIYEFFRRCITGAELLPDKNPKRGGTIRRPGYNRKKWEQKKRPVSTYEELPTYREIMERLVHRYIHMMKKEMKMDGVNEDDLLEIKQDISSLRFELRDDRRREIIRWSSQLDGTKKEIIRTLSIAPKDKPRLLTRRTELRDTSMSPIQFSERERLPSPMATSPCPSPTSFFAVPLDEDKRIPADGRPNFPTGDATSVYASATELLPNPNKKLSSVSFKEGDDSEKTRNSPRFGRFASQRSPKSRANAEHGITLTLPPPMSQRNAAVQTDSPRELPKMDNLKSEILRLIDAHVQNDGARNEMRPVPSFRTEPRSFQIALPPSAYARTVNGAQDERLATFMSHQEKESII